MPVYDPKRHAGLGHVMPAPLEYAGQWVAWNSDRSRILAHAATLEEVAEAVNRQEHPRISFGKIPRLGPYIGAQLG